MSVETLLQENMNEAITSAIREKRVRLASTLTLLAGSHDLAKPNLQDMKLDDDIKSILDDCYTLGIENKQMSTLDPGQAGKSIQSTAFEVQQKLVNQKLDAAKKLVKIGKTLVAVGIAGILTTIAIGFFTFQSAIDANRKSAKFEGLNSQISSLTQQRNALKQRLGRR